MSKTAVNGTYTGVDGIYAAVNVCSGSRVRSQIAIDVCYRRRFRSQIAVNGTYTGVDGAYGGRFGG